MVKVAEWAKYVALDLQQAAKEFAENAGPVVDLIVAGLEALAALRDFVALDAAAREKIIANMQTLDRFLASLLADLGRIGTIIKTELQGLAKAFAENAGPVVD